jgi:hypothetical protein
VADQLEIGFPQKMGYIAPGAGKGEIEKPKEE